MHPCPGEVTCSCFTTLLTYSKSNGWRSLWLLSRFTTPNTFTWRSTTGTRLTRPFFTLREFRWPFTTTFTPWERTRPTLWNTVSRTVTRIWEKARATLCAGFTSWSLTKTWLRSWDAETRMICALLPFLCSQTPTLTTQHPTSTRASDTTRATLIVTISPWILPTYSPKSTHSFTSSTKWTKKKSQTNLHNFTSRSSPWAHAGPKFMRPSVPTKKTIPTTRTCRIMDSSKSPLIPKIPTSSFPFPLTPHVNTWFGFWIATSSQWWKMPTMNSPVIKTEPFSLPTATNTFGMTKNSR